MEDKTLNVCLNAIDQVIVNNLINDINTIRDLE